MAVTTITSTTTPVATGTTTKNSGVSSSTTVAKSTVATSSTTATTTASTTARSYVSSATASTTASTTYRVNSSTTSKVTYSSGTTGSSTTPVSSTNETSGININDVVWDGSIIKGLKPDAFDRFIYNLGNILDEGVSFGVEYNLGEVSYNVGVGPSRVSYSASVEFSENDPNALVEVGLGIKEGFMDLEQYVKNNNIGVNADTIARFDTSSFSDVELKLCDDMTTHGVINIGNIAMDLNLTALDFGIVDLTVSVDNEIDDYATVTNEINYTGIVRTNIIVPDADETLSEEEDKQSEEELELWEKGWNFMSEMADEVEKNLDYVWENITESAMDLAEEVAEFGEKHQEEIAITATTAFAVIAIASCHPEALVFI